MGVIECNVKIQERDPEMMHAKLRLKTYLSPIALSNKIKSIDVLENDGECEGSIMNWAYVSGESGSVFDSREKIQQIDDNKLAISSSFFAGDIGSYYKVFVVNWRVMEEQNGNSVKCSIYYALQDHVQADPNRYLDLFCELIQALDKFSLQGANMPHLFRNAVMALVNK